MKERIVRFWLYVSYAVFLSLLIASPVFAAIPLITDDTGTQGKGKYQIELFGEYAHDKEESVTNKNGNFSATLTYGISEPVDVVLSIPYQIWRANDSGSEARGSGLSDPTIEAKWRIFEQEGLSFALKPGFTIPLGDEEKDLGPGKMTFHLFLIASKEIKPWSFHINVGYIVNNNSEDDRKDIWHASFASTFDVVKNVKLVGDIGVESNPERSSGNPPAYMLGGLIYSIGENLDFGLGIKGGLTKPEPGIAVRGGITWRF